MLVICYYFSAFIPNFYQVTHSWAPIHFVFFPLFQLYAMDEILWFISHFVVSPLFFWPHIEITTRNSFRILRGLLFSCYDVIVNLSIRASQIVYEQQLYRYLSMCVVCVRLKHFQNGYISTG